jgi:hypothetical protein
MSRLIRHVCPSRDLDNSPNLVDTFFNPRFSTTQVNYIAAFVHAHVGEDVYIEMPKSIGKPDIVLKLRKSLYGLNQYPHNYFHHL